MGSLGRRAAINGYDILLLPWKVQSDFKLFSNFEALILRLVILTD